MYTVFSVISTRLHNSFHETYHTLSCLLMFNKATLFTCSILKLNYLTRRRITLLVHNWSEIRANHFYLIWCTCPLMMLSISVSHKSSFGSLWGYCSGAIVAMLFIPLKDLLFPWEHCCLCQSGNTQPPRGHKLHSVGLLSMRHGIRTI